MDEAALERAKARIAAAVAGRPEPAALEAALERSRDQIEALASVAAELEASLPERVGAAVHDGLRAEVLPVARHIAEIRGLLNQAIRRLERIEGDLRAASIVAALRLALLHAIAPASRLSTSAGRVAPLKITQGHVKLPGGATWRERNPWLAFEDGVRVVRGFVQRLESGAWGPVPARLGEDLRSLTEGSATVVIKQATAGAFGYLLASFILEGRSAEATPLRREEFFRMLRYGVPAGFNWAFEFYAIIAFINIVVASLGTSSLAALMAVFQINAVAFMPAFALASAGAILVGQSIGEGRKDEVAPIVATTFKASAGWTGLAALAYLAIPRILLAPFVSPDSDGTFLQVGAAMLMMSALWQAFDSAGMTFTEALRAAGDTSFPMWTRGFLAWGFFLPGSWIAVKSLGGTEIAAMAFLLGYLGLLAVVLLWRFRGGAWRSIELVEPVPAE